MISRYEVTLNNEKLSEIDEKILILDIAYSEPGHTYQQQTLAKKDGARQYARYKAKTTVVVTFAIRAYDTAERQAICQSVCLWAKNGGVLRTSDRKGQYLRCDCDKLPYIASAKNWTDSLTVQFSAYDNPYWQNNTTDTITLNGTAGNGTLYVTGSAPETVVSVNITARATLKNITLQVADTTMTLSGLSVGNGQTVAISYTTRLIQQIRQNGKTSVLNCRSGADDLIAICGQNNTVAFSANANCTVEFVARGLWE